MRSPNADNRPWVQSVLRLKERLGEAAQWYPFPAMIGFALVMILGGHLLTDLNPRLGARVDVIPFDAPRHQDGGIWLGVYASGGQLNIVTSDRRRFSWSLSDNQVTASQELTDYLKQRTYKEAYSTALKMQTNMTQTTAVIAVDQTLKYAHLQPVIYALAQAGISQYGFETRLIRR